MTKLILSFLAMMLSMCLLILTVVQSTPETKRMDFLAQTILMCFILYTGTYCISRVWRRRSK
jgi:hypothetical protein